MLNPIFKNKRFTEIYLPKISEFLIALIIGVIFSLNFDFIQNVSYLLLLLIVLHNLIGLSAGYFVAFLFNLPFEQKKTIAIEVGMQNSGLGMTLSIIHFGKLVALPAAILVYGIIFLQWYLFIYGKKNKLIILKEKLLCKSVQKNQKQGRVAICNSWDKLFAGGCGAN